MWRKKILNVLDNVDTLVFNKQANRETLLDIFKLYYTDKKKLNIKYKDMFRQRREQMLETVLNRVRKRFFNNKEIDFINKIVNKEEIIDKQNIITELAKKYKNYNKLDLEILFDAFRFSKWVIVVKYKWKIKNNYIIFNNEELKKYFNILYKTIKIKWKENKDKLLIDSIKKALSKKIWEDKTNLLINKFCQYVNFYCSGKVIFTKSKINTIDKTKEFITQKLNEWRNSFYFKDIKEIIETNPNNILRALNIMQEQWYIKRIYKWLYKIK